MSWSDDQFKKTLSTSTVIEGYLLRRDIYSDGLYLRAGTPIRKCSDGRYHSLDGIAIPQVSESDICCSSYRGVMLCEVRCDDEGHLFARRLGAQEVLEPVAASHLGFDLQRGDGCVCVNYGGRYFALEFFGW